MTAAASLAPWIGPALALVCAGLAAGFLGGLVGAGGGLIVVPVLFHVFSALGVDPAVTMHLAAGTALAAVVPMSILGARTHWASGNVSTALFARLWLPMTMGAAGAALVAGSVNAAQLRVAFAVLTIVVAANLVRRSAWQFGSGLPSNAGTLLIGTSIGATSVLIGIGGATLTVPVLHAFNTPMRVAIGTAATLGMFIGIPGAVAFAAGGVGTPGLPPGSIGYVNLLAAAVLVPCSSIAVRWGVRCSRLFDERTLRMVFAGCLCVSALRMAS